MNNTLFTDVETYTGTISEILMCTDNPKVVSLTLDGDRGKRFLLPLESAHQYHVGMKIRVTWKLELTTEGRN